MTNKMTPKEMQERDNQVRELVHEATNKFTDAILGIENLFGLKFGVLDSEVDNYKGEGIQLVWRRK